MPPEMRKPLPGGSGSGHIEAALVGSLEHLTSFPPSQQEIGAARLSRKFGLPLVRARLLCDLSGFGRRAA